MSITKRININEITEHLDPHAIKNFIISDRSVSIPLMTTDCPFIIDGIGFAICIEGKAHIRINFKEYRIEKNSIITVMPHFVVEYLTNSSNFKMEFLIFSTDFLTEMPKVKNLDLAGSVMEHPCLKMTDQDTQRYIEFHDFILKQYKRKDHPFRKTMAKGLLYALLAEIGNIYCSHYIQKESADAEVEKSKASIRQEELTMNFFRLLLENHKTEKVLQFYADSLFLTPKYLSSVIKARTGRTASAWIIEALIASAKHMLKTTNMNIVQISDELNFPNPSFFGRFFKQQTGVTPTQYRKAE